MKTQLESDTGSNPPACSPLRKAFEAWISAPPFERDTTRNPLNGEEYAWPGHYREYEVQLAWDAWDAAAATIRETLADPAKTHILMLRGDIAWTAPNLRHVIGDTSLAERIEGLRERVILEGLYGVDALDLVLGLISANDKTQAPT